MFCIGTGSNTRCCRCGIFGSQHSWRNVMEANARHAQTCAHVRCTRRRILWRSARISDPKFEPPACVRHIKAIAHRQYLKSQFIASIVRVAMVKAKTESICHPNAKNIDTLFASGVSCNEAGNVFLKFKSNLKKANKADLRCRTRHKISCKLAEGCKVCTHGLVVHLEPN